jgi:beta-lactamase class A
MLTLVLAAALLPQAPAPLEAALRQVITRSGADVGLAFRRLDGGAELFIDADKAFHAASTMKVPVMIELFRQSRAGTLSLDEPLPIRNQFRSIVDGTPYSLSEGDDSDREVYAAVGKTMTLRHLCELMIVTSSNFAANLLIDRLGAASVQRTTEALGAGGMQVLRGVEDQKAFDKGLNNTTTARALMVLLERLARHQAVDAQSDAAMIAILERQRLNEGIPAGVPAGTAVAHKTGSITRIHHDAAVVYGPHPYVLVVLVRGIDEQQKSAALIAELSRVVYDANVR